MSYGSLWLLEQELEKEIDWRMEEWFKEKWSEHYLKNEYDGETAQRNDAKNIKTKCLNLKVKRSKRIDNLCDKVITCQSQICKKWTKSFLCRLKFNKDGHDQPRSNDKIVILWLKYKIRIYQWSYCNRWEIVGLKMRDIQQVLFLIKIEWWIY